MTRLSINSNRESIREAWDAIAQERFSQQQAGEDDSFNSVLMPAVINLLPKKMSQVILDVGCGVGVLSNRLSKESFKVDCLDCSHKSIVIARKHFYTNDKLNFFESYIEEFDAPQKYDTIVANMVLMDLYDLEGGIFRISKLIKKRGVFIFTIIHPCFWPKYCGYDHAEWFSYEKELPVERYFEVSKIKSKCKTVHIHRPLQKYFDVLRKNKFLIEYVEELYGKNFNYPRFLIFKCRKN